MPKISALPENTSPDGTSVLPIVEGGVTQKVSIDNLLAETIAAQAVVDANQNTIITNLSTNKADLVNPAFVGIPTAPTAAPSTSTTQIATTAFVTAADNLRLRISGADTMLGNLNMGSNKITNLTNGTAAQDAVSLSQMQTADALKATTLQDYDPTATSAAPVTHTSHSGTPLKGDRYYITVAGSICGGAHVLQIGDIIEARVDTPGNTTANWSVVQANSVQATTTVAGILETSTDAEALAKSSILVAVTPSNFAAMASSETFAGLAEIATQAEVDAGTDDLRYITPLKLATSSHVQDTGWLTLDGFEHMSAGLRPEYRVIGKEIHFRGTIVIALDNGGALVNYTTETDYSTVLSVTPYTAGAAGTGAVDVDANGSITFNRSVAVIPTAAHYPDASYSMPYQIIIRRINSDTAGIQLTYTATVVLIILSTGVMRIATLRDAEDFSSSTVLGNSPLRFLNSNVVANDFALDFRDTGGGDTLHGNTAAAAHTYEIVQSARTHEVTMDAANPGNLGGFMINITGLKAFLA